MSHVRCNLSNSGHTRRFQIKPLSATGWEVREEEDSHVVSSRVYNDWHRVERARSVSLRVAVEPAGARQAGWARVRRPAYLDEAVARVPRQSRSAAPRGQACRAVVRRGRPPTAFRSAGRSPTRARAGDRARARGCDSRRDTSAARIHAGSGEWLRPRRSPPRHRNRRRDTCRGRWRRSGIGVLSPRRRTARTRAASSRRLNGLVT